MSELKEQGDYFGTEKVSKILLKLAPPVMLAQLIQSLYNIVDSAFVGRYSDSGLTALSIVFPLQLLMIALASGTGVGINTIMAAKLGMNRPDKANEYAGVGTPLAAVLWVLFAAVCYAIMPAYAKTQTDTPAVIADVIAYGRIVCLFSLGIFLESVWTKILQARGDMKTPMAAQIIGALTNIVLDAVLILGFGPIPALGMVGAAIATVIGQTVAALIVMKKALYRSPALSKYPHYVGRIFKMGAPNMLMQSTYTLYIFGLNMILATFSDAAVTVLGLYYKWQNFFFIPLGAMQTCLVPIISFNYATQKLRRCKSALNTALIYGGVIMVVSMAVFIMFPAPLIQMFSSDPLVSEIGIPAFRIIGLGFIPLVVSLTYPILFQAVGKSGTSTFLTVLRTIVLFVPLAYLFSRFGLQYFWFTYLVTDGITATAGFLLAHRFFKTSAKEELS